LCKDIGLTQARGQVENSAVVDTDQEDNAPADGDYFKEGRPQSRHSQGPTTTTRLQGVLELDQPESGAQGLRSKLTTQLPRLEQFASHWKTAARAKESKTDDLANSNEVKDK